MTVRIGRKIIIFTLSVLFCLALSSEVNCQQLCKGEWRLPDNYPPGFSGWGRIDRLSTNEVVIDDVLYAMSAAVTYHVPTANSVPAAWFERGIWVGFILDSNKQIVSIWKLPE